MLEEQNHTNSQPIIQLNQNIIKKKSPYLLQLKSFEDRFRNKGLKNKVNSMMLRKPPNQNEIESEVA